MFFLLQTCSSRFDKQGEQIHWEEETGKSVGVRDSVYQSCRFLEKGLLHKNSH